MGVLPVLAVALVCLAAVAPLPAPAAAAPVGPDHPTSTVTTPSLRSLPVPAHPARGPVEPREFVSGDQGRLLVATGDPAAMPNNGLRANLTDFSEPPLGPAESFQVSVEETIGTHDAVFGLFTNTGTAPVPFFSVFSNTTDVTEHLAYWDTAPSGPLLSFDFELTPLHATVWQLLVNGQLFGGNASNGTFDFGASEATWLPGLTFSEIALYGTEPSAPATFSATLAFAVQHPTGWYLPESASETFSTTGGPAWGIEGRLQHPTLAPGAIVSGTSIAPVANGTQLWSGGPVPVSVSITLPSTALGIDDIAGTVTVLATGGAPLPGASVFLADELGGNFTPSSVVTGATGSVSVLFETPNVTASATDTVLATVTTFGYPGASATSVSVDPAIHVFVHGPGGAPTVGPGGSIGLVFVTQAPDGVVAPSIYLSLGTTGGVLTPSAGLTGSDGRLETTLTAPNATGFVLVRAIVGGGGAWGATSLNVSVRAASGTSLPPWVGDVASVGIVLALAVAFAWYVRRRLARRPPVPPMRLPRPPSARPPAPTGSPASAPDASRTPPGPGAP